MRDGRASTTAKAVAFFRAVASLPGSPFQDVDDPLASTLIDGPFRPVLEVLRRRPGAARWLRLISAGVLDHVALRTATIDDAVREAVERGAKQLVVLGAGLDARAFRMRELQNVIAYEVDFLATQSRKRARLSGLLPVAREARFVPVDFEHDSLGDRLASVGHEHDVPTVWIWEGVTPYLAPEATAATLEVIARRSAVRSTLVVSYVTPALVRIDLGGTTLGLPPSLFPGLRAAFSVLGEPVRGTLHPVDVANLLSRGGLTLRADSGSRDWATRHPVRGGVSRVEVMERLAIATKDG